MSKKKVHCKSGDFLKNTPDLTMAVMCRDKKENWRGTREENTERKMAAFTVARSSCGLITGLRTSLRGLAQTKHVAVAASLPQTRVHRDSRWYSVSHLSVKERIDNKRKAALVGGGQKRIEAQHKKVNRAQTHCYFTCLLSVYCGSLSTLMTLSDGWLMQCNAIPCSKAYVSCCCW